MAKADDVADTDKPNIADLVPKIVDVVPNIADVVPNITADVVPVSRYMIFLVLSFIPASVFFR